MGFGVWGLGLGAWGLDLIIIVSKRVIPFFRLENRRKVVEDRAVPGVRTNSPAGCRVSVFGFSRVWGLGSGITLSLGSARPALQASGLRIRVWGLGLGLGFGA